MVLVSIQPHGPLSCSLNSFNAPASPHSFGLLVPSVKSQDLVFTDVHVPQVAVELKNDDHGPTLHV